MSTATRTITITDPVGIHARPASQFAQAAAASGAKVTITVDGDDAEAVADKLAATIAASE